MSDEESPAPPAGETVQSASAALMEARERLGLTQKEIADKLYLTTTFIKYMDEGEFDRLPRPVFIKGYLRSYAREVELSGDDVVALYEAESQTVGPMPEIKGVTGERVAAGGMTGPVLETGLIGLVGLAIVGGIIWWLVSDADFGRQEVSRAAFPEAVIDDPAGPVVDFDAAPPPASEAAAGITVEQFEITDEAAVSLTEAGDGVTAPASEAADGATIEDVEATDEVTAPVSEAADGATIDQVEAVDEVTAPVSEAADEATIDQVEATDEAPAGDEVTMTVDGNAILVDAGGPERVQLSFADRCWVEIEEGGYGRVYSRLNRPGDLLTVRGTTPFTIVLGRATGVEMLYNGRPFDIEPFIGENDLAKLTIAD